MAAFMPYMVVLPGKKYFGCTRKDLDDRGADMKRRPVFWLRGHSGIEKLCLQPLLGRRVSLQVFSGGLALLRKAWLV